MFSPAKVNFERKRQAEAHTMATWLDPEQRARNLIAKKCVFTCLVRQPQTLLQGLYPKHPTVVPKAAVRTISPIPLGAPMEGVMKLLTIGR